MNPSPHTFFTDNNALTGSIPSEMSALMSLELLGLGKIVFFTDLINIAESTKFLILNLNMIFFHRYQ